MFIETYSSCIEGIIWPPVPAPVSAQLLTMLNYLGKSQWLTEDEIVLRQEQQLFSLLQYAKKYVPYYESVLPEIKSKNIFDIWNQVPILKREKLLEVGKQICSSSSPITHGPTSKSFRLVDYLHNDATHFFWNLFTLRDTEWHKRNTSGKIALIGTHPLDGAVPPIGKEYADWGSPTNHVTKTGRSYFLNHTTVDEEAKWLQYVDPDVLLIFPSNLKELIHYMMENKITIPNLKEIMTRSEIVENDLRELVKNYFGFALTDVYSADEVGYIALQCPETEHYHIQSENLFVEILNEQGDLCKPGEIGRVILTTLHNFASPLIRYEIGDYAMKGSVCPCGRGLPVLTKIMGRQRNILTLPNGKKIWPEFYQNGVSLFDVIPKCRFQFIQHSLDKIEIKVTCDPLSKEAHDRAVAQIQTLFYHPFNIEFTYVEEIERLPNNKFEEFKSLLERY